MEGPSSSEPRIDPRWLWFGALGGPLAFALDRLAGIVFVAGGCGGASHGGSGLGLSPQASMTAITVLTGLIAIAAGLLSWRIWHETGSREEEVSAGTIRTIPFWALGSIFLSAFFFVAIVVTGVIALEIGSTCP